MSRNPSSCPKTVFSGLHGHLLGPAVWFPMAVVAPTPARVPVGVNPADSGRERGLGGEGRVIAASETADFDFGGCGHDAANHGDLCLEDSSVTASIASGTGVSTTLQSRSGGVGLIELPTSRP